MESTLTQSPDTLDDTADTIAGELPEPQQHAIDQATAELAIENPKAAAAELDALGVPWNPDIHATGKDGKGVRTNAGNWRKRRGVKGSAPYLNTGVAEAPTAEPVDEGEVSGKAVEAQSRMAGAMLATIMIRCSVAVGGDAFHPRVIEMAGGVKYNEEKMLQAAWGDYFVAKGVVDVPPGIMLISALGMYYMPRMQAPEVKQRASGLLAWMKDKATDAWYYLRKKKRARKPDPKSPPPNSAGIPEQGFSADDFPHGSAFAR